MAVLNQMSVLEMIKEFRRNWHTLCNSERTTLCGADSMLLTLQLSIAENNKQHNGEFTVSLSDVLLTWKYLLHEKLNLPVENVEVVDHYEDIKKTYDDFLKKSNMLDLIDVYEKYTVLTSTCENNRMISSIELRDFLSGNEGVVHDRTNLDVPTSPVKCSQYNEKVKLVAKKIIFSYLNLLVNSKNDLAVAHILNIPDRGLGREAFTSLKHVAREKQMSIFLVATSFIRTLELGGKGYAPSPSDPLRAHIKGLSNFINFMDKLNEIIGEIPNPSVAGGRILSVIKMQLIKGKNCGDPFYQAVEEVVQDLDLRIKNVISSQQEGVPVNTNDNSPTRPKSHVINHGTAYCGRDTVKALLVLLDEEAACGPTRNKAELLYDDENTVHHSGTTILTLFRSPIQVNNALMKPLRERICNSMQEKTKMKQMLIRSQFACTYKDDFIITKDKWNVNSSSKPLCSLHLENDLPACVTEGEHSSARRSTINMCSGNVHLDGSKNNKVPRKLSSQIRSSKRKQVDLDSENIHCDNGSEIPQHKDVKVPKASDDSHNKLNGKVTQVPKGNRCPTKSKLITGQTKLTQFFRL